MRQASRTDANQAEIVDALRRVGATVQLLHTVGHGCPDLLVGHFDATTGEARNYLLEVKTATGKLTPDEAEWHNGWNGHVAIVRSVEEALGVIGAI